MEYVNLGRTGLKVSRICLGCMTYGRPPAEGEPKAGRHAWALNEAESQPFLKQALDLGYPLPGLALNYLACIAAKRGDVESMRSLFTLMRLRSEMRLRKRSSPPANTQTRH